MKSQKEMEWDEKYGKLSEEERKEELSNSLSIKLGAYYKAQNEAREAGKAKYELPYGEYAKRIKACEKRIEELPGIIDGIVQTERKRLEKEYDDSKKYGLVLSSNREEWISDQMFKFMALDEEYKTAKLELRETQDDLDKYICKKSEWEKNHKDLIAQAKRETEMRELLSADADTLAELGIVIPKQERTQVTGSKKNLSSGDNPLAMDLDALYEVVKMKRELGV